MRLARLQDATGETARAVLRHLKPGLLEAMDIAQPELGPAVDTQEAIASRHQRSRALKKLQHRYRAMIAVKHGGSGERYKSNVLRDFQDFTRPTASSQQSNGLGGALAAAMQTARSKRRATIAGTVSGVSGPSGLSHGPSPRLSALLRNAEKGHRITTRMVNGVRPSPPSARRESMPARTGQLAGAPSGARPASARAWVSLSGGGLVARAPAAARIKVMRVARSAQLALPEQDFTGQQIGASLDEQLASTE